MRTTTVLALLLLALAACNRPGKPSPEYAQAREKWSSLLRERLADAYQDPRADEVVALLARVDPKSIDYPSANKLKGEIEVERNSARAREAELEKEQAEAQAALARAQAAFAARPSGTESAAPAVAAAAPEQAVETQPREGMDAGEFRSKFSRCFEYKHDSLVSGQTGGQVWGLKNLGHCRDLHPGYDSKAVLLFDNKVAGIRSAEELAPKKYKLVDGGLVPAE